MKIYLLLFALNYGVILSQITYGDLNPPNIGDKILINKDVTNTYTPTNSGPNQYWNFSTLVLDVTDTIDIVNPSSTTFGALYPTSDISFEYPYNVPLFGELKFQMYVDNSPNSAEFVGMTTDSIKGFFTNPLAQITAPVNYQGFSVDTFAYRFDDKASRFGNNALDSARVRVNGVLYRGVDSWGEITLPQGAFQVLRLSDTVIENYLYEVKASVGSWYQYFAGIDTTYTHTYITNDENIDLFVLRYNLNSNGDLLQNSDNQIEWNNGLPYVEVNSEFSIPSGFSPNNDGVNDKFIIDNISDYPENKLTILNRWGSVVYEKVSYQNEWEGTNDNGVKIGKEDLPVGTYFYILDLGENVSEDRMRQGYIYLSR